MEWPVSVGANLYKGYDLVTVFQSLSRLGIRYVDLDFIKPPATFKGNAYLAHISEEDLGRSAEIRTMMTDHGLEAVTFSGHMYLVRAEEVSLFKKKMRFAREIGAKIISTNQGPRERADDFYRYMEEVVREAEILDLIVGLETAMPGDILETGQDAGKLMERIGSPQVRLTYDTGNIFYSQRGNINLPEDFHVALPYCSNLHFKDACLQDDRLHYCAVGQGLVSFDPICQMLREDHRHLPVTVEVPYFFESRNWSRFDTLDEIKPLAAVEEIVQTSLDFIRQRLGIVD
ncbi:MAG TPA: sugar phosphate isomerase/epimerase [Atribacteraceae bacterium]|nr:sugar phosphate isomerase/epimerase [Atribacteraceae bacterium]